MGLDWKWLIGLAIGVGGIAAPILYDRYEKKQERQAALQNIIQEAAAVQQRIVRLKSLARGTGFPSQVEPAHVMRKDALALADMSLDALKPFEPMQDTRELIDAYEDNINFLFNDMSYCAFLDETALLPLTYAIEEVHLLRNTLRFELFYDQGKLSESERQDALDKMLEKSVRGDETAFYTSINGCRAASD
ncbi:hypothetical protein [Tropicibacter naphthalenivorans]|uniref:Uncharacterized protein n=1 Tax=Tropicibacter naphthalenivorans TaxID=441103 RepID=A0A0P1G0K6_9RHOB|nr:hypothetical protein [Tropicibacter naphthalenivorans]CUH75019.1 hypothetical protein TRN7648_00209 [Tropicibacter naphthalenivorans]SMC47316.1 hypothetical protein SAMN04488093_101671 [Tropicibacter naphthalenivorans]